MSVGGRWFPVVAVVAGLLDASCTKSPPGIEAELDRLAEVAAAARAHDTAVRQLAGDLEQWSAREGHPASAENLMGTLLLRDLGFHSPPSGEDEHERAYQELEMRFATLMSARDSIARARAAARERLLATLTRSGLPSPTRESRHAEPVFAPPSDDTLRFATRGQRCTAVSVTTLPSREGVHICINVERRCVRNPGAPWWVICIDHCFDVIGWVPEGGDFQL